MKVLYLWDGEYPWDIRVEKTCDSLINLNHEVHLVCRNKEYKKRNEIFSGIYIHRIATLPKLLKKLNNFFTFPFFINPVWLIELFKVTSNEKPDIIIARDLPMAPAAIFIGKIFHIRVVLDMAECYPELLRLIWKFEPFKFRNIFIRNTLFADVVEYFVLKLIDHVFVMVEESKNRLLKKHVPKNKISIVSNTPNMHRFQKAKCSFPGLLHNHKGKLILLYVGLLNHSRGVDTVIESLNQYSAQNKNFFCLIIGSGKAEKELRERVNDLHLNNNIEFSGWINNTEIPEYIASSDICLVPHHKCSHWDNTIPNKLFDYMAASKPVLVSNVDPMARIVGETNCGLVYEDYNTDSFTEKLKFLSDVNLRNKLGINGSKAVQDKYNWSNDSNIMINSLHELITK